MFRLGGVSAADANARALLRPVPTTHGRRRRGPQIGPANAFRIGRIAVGIVVAPTTHTHMGGHVQSVCVCVAA